MKYRCFVLMILFFSVSTPSHAIFFDAELTTDDELAEYPGAGNFYYDLYRVTVDVPIQIEIFMNPFGAFAPWIGYWEGDLSPTPNYYDPPPVFSRGPDNDDQPGDQIYMSFDAQPGTEYLVMAATNAYNPTDLGAYWFFVTDRERVESGYQAISWSLMATQSVPAPASWIVLGLGLAILGVVNRRHLKN